MKPILLCILSLILISGLAYAHGDEGDIFEGPIFVGVFGAMGIVLYLYFLSKGPQIHPIELGGAFFGGYFFIKLAFNFLISALA